ncbi:MAG: hypothetical protein SynsKO_03280 [Synoicihabitans sp.]
MIERSFFTRLKGWLCLALLWGSTGCETTDSSHSTPSAANHHTLDFVIDELAAREPAADTAVAQLLADLQQLQQSIEAGSFVKRALHQFDVEPLTTENPIYWKAVLEMGKDRVLLYLLHAVLLADQNRWSQAIEWSVFCRQTEYLAPDFDDRWSNWELGDFRRNTYFFGFRQPPPGTVANSNSTFVSKWEVIAPDGYDRLILTRQRLDGYYPTRQSPSRKPSATPSFSAAREENAPEEETELAVSKLFGYWPEHALLRSDELKVISEWLAASDLLPFAIVARLASLDGRDFSEDAEIWKLLEQQLAESLISGWRDDPALLTKSHSEKYVGKLSADRISPPLQPHLEKDIRQRIRRMLALEPYAKNSPVDLAEFYERLSRDYALLHNPEDMSRTAKRVRDVSFSPAQIAEIEMLHVKLDGTEEEKLRAFQRLEKADPQRKRSAGSQAIMAAELGQWTKVSENYWAQRQLYFEYEDPKRALYATLYAQVFALLAGSSRSIDPDEFKQEEWIDQLRQVLEGDQEIASLLEAAKTDDPWETSGRICEAYFFAAMTPGRPGSQRRELLKACIETGRADFIEYQLADSILRQWE